MPQVNNLGVVSMVPMDDWDATVTYQKLNYVRHKGANYMAKGPSLNVEPGVTQNWEAVWMLTIYDGSSVQPYGTYPNMMVGGVVATELTTENLNDYLSLDYCGKVFYGSAGNSVVNKPDGVENFCMSVTQSGTGEITQVLWSSTNYMYMRNTLNTTWVQFAWVNGTYNQMTVGKAIADGEGNVIPQTYATKTALQQEKDERVAADNTLQSNIDSEATARESADEILQNNIDAEEQARTAADTTLQQNINAEAAARQNADNTLQSNINAEETARIAADNALQQAIDDEETARQNADNTLQDNINSEAQTRASADTALGNRIDDIVDGTTTVGKAQRDASGNTITSFYAHNLTFTVDSSTYVLTATLISASGAVLATQTVDLPLESVVVSGTYDDTTKEVVLTLQNGSEVRFSVADLVDGLATQTALNAEIAARQAADNDLSERITTLEGGGTTDPNAVHFTEQELTSSQQSQARTNIGAAAASDLNDYLPLTGGTLTGNLTGKYITGTWLQATAANHQTSAASKIAVFDVSGWLYYRTSAELLSDIGAAAQKNEHNGFEAGNEASAQAGGAIGSGAIADAGGAIGQMANAGDGGAVGNGAHATTGGAVGQASRATTGGGVGQGAQAVDGFAGGYLAKATASGAVQLGTGTNNNANTLQFRGYQIIDANGNIPAQRLSANSPVRSVNGKTGAVTLSAADVGAATITQVNETSMVPDSGNATNLAVPESGGRVEIDVDGWLCVNVSRTTANGQYMTMTVQKEDGTDKWGCVNKSATYFQNNYPVEFLPVKKGDYVRISYNIKPSRIQLIRSKQV